MIYLGRNKIKGQRRRMMERDIFNDIVVVKRSGQRVDFNSTKVAIAVKKG